MRHHRCAEKLAPVHPGEVLREDFLIPTNLSPYAVARACGVPRTRIERLARERTPITADTALRLSRYFGTTAGFWMNIQAQYDLECAADALGDIL
jgi:addiction module HigA family antidote